jgi:hypothetical protein
MQVRFLRKVKASETAQKTGNLALSAVKVTKTPEIVLIALKFI